MHYIDQFDALKSYYKQLLPTLSDESWAITSGVLRFRSYKKGELLVKEGDTCNAVSFVLRGLARLYYVMDGREKVIMFANEHNYISDYESFLTRRPAKSFVQAMENTEVVDILYDDLQMLYDKVPEANILGRKIAENLFLMTCDYKHNQYKETIQERYDRLIAEMPWLMQRVPQYMIASYLGVTPEALSRIKSRVGRQRKAA